jgi:hypothetical protein
MVDWQLSRVEEHLEVLSMADTNLGFESLARIIFGLKKLVSLPKVLTRVNRKLTDFFYTM